MNEPKKNTSLGSLLVVFVLLLSIIVWYGYVNRPCAQPITYRIGTFDTQFGISENQFIADTQTSVALWNQAAGHTLLEYSATGTMPVNFVYDYRQQLASADNQIQNQESENEATVQTLNTQEAQYQSDEASYQQARAAYTAEATTYEDKLTESDADGASPAQIASLNAEQAKLNSENQSLNAEASQLNQEGSSLNAQVNAINAQISQTNMQAKQYNTQAGTDFNEGEYMHEDGSSSIYIYEYQTQTQLLRVLAHEFGHSLGLGHDTGTESIMNPYNFGTTLAISPEDMAELKAECNFPSNELHVLFPSL